MKLVSSLVAALLLLHQVDANPDVYSKQSEIYDAAKESSYSLASAAFQDKVKMGEYVKIGSILGTLVETMSSGVTVNDVLTNNFIGYLDVTVTELSTSESEVLVDVIFKKGNDFSDGGIPQDFTELGFRNRKCFTNVCLGYAKTMNLVQLSQYEMVNFIRPSFRPLTNVGSVTSEGDMAMNTDLVRDTYGLSGEGVTVCAMSDSFDCDNSAATDYAMDVAAGDLPDNVNVLLDITSGCIDEGRAMLQLIYDVVPSANLAFRTAFLGPNDFAQGILDLAEAGCDVIVDDIAYLFQPYFQDGVIAQAVDTVSSQGIPYFSSAGNLGTKSWHTDTGFVDSGSTFRGGALHNFATDGQIDVVFGFQTEESVSHAILLQWDEPFASVPGSAGCQSDVDLVLVDGQNQVLFVASTNNIGGDAIEGIGLTTGTFPNGTVLGIAIVLNSGPPPGHMKIVLFDRAPPFLEAEYGLGSSTLVGQANAAGGAGVGAVSYEMTPRYGVDPAVQEFFSSAGGTPIFFDAAGNRLDSAEIREQPRFMGPNRGLTSFFFPPSNRFAGTSASAPHVAALAALMLEGDPTLTPPEIYTILQDTANDMDDTATDEFDRGYDTGTGYGFVQGDAALAVVVDSSPTPTPSAAPTADPEGCASCDKDVCGPRNRCLFRNCSKRTGVWLCERRREVDGSRCKWMTRKWQCDSCSRKGRGRKCCKGCSLVEGLSLGDVSF